MSELMRLDPSTSSRQATTRPDRVGLIAARSKAEARAFAVTITEALLAAGIDVVPEAELASGHLERVNAIIVLGGDGLMIRTANAYPGVPLLGINFGNVGFLALIEQRDWEQAMSALLKGEYTVQQGPTLQAVLAREGDIVPQGWAINDVVVRSGMRMVDIEIYIDGHYVNTYPGDGMIVATPHGSTAYGMAAGGPILTAGVRGFAIVPISCHSPIRTPFVVPEEAVIEMVVANDHDASLILDGREQVHLHQWDVIRVSRGEHAFQLVMLESTNFYEAFRTKFNFRIRPDAVPSRGHPEELNGASAEPMTESIQKTLKGTGEQTGTPG